jgi:filamentous hemagglutinin
LAIIIIIIIIISKQQLDLAVGVTLTSQQVAALTHDIAWLEEHEVNGEKVLVPVLYLANANHVLTCWPATTW